MSNAMREEIEELVDTAWDLYDQASCPKVKEQYTMDIMELLSNLPENVAILKIVQ